MGLRDRLAATTVARLATRAAAAYETGDLRTARDGFTAAAEACRGRPALLLYEIQSLGNAAGAADGLGDHAAALALYRRALDLCDRAPGDAFAMMRPPTLLGLARALRWTGAYADAATALAEARRVLDTTDRPTYGDNGPELLAAHILAEQTAVAAYTGDWPRADLLAAETLAHAERHCPEMGPPALMNLADVAVHTGRDDLAEDFARQALAGFERLAEPVPVAEMRRALAQILLRTGRPDEAEPLLVAALAFFTDTGARHQIANTRDMLGVLAALRDEHDTAHRHWHRAAEDYDAAGQDMAAAEVRGRLGTLAYLTGDHDTGEALLRGTADTALAHGLGAAAAQADAGLAAVMERRLAAEPDPDPALLARAIALAVPAALALDAVAYGLADGHRREQWRRRVAEPAVALAFRLAARAGDPALVAGLVETRCAGTPLGPGREPGVGEPPPVFGLADAPPPTGPDDSALDLGTALALAAIGSGLCVAPPPRLLDGPGGTPLLATHLDRAERRYGTAIRAEGSIPTW